jgi:hypothetical protein
MTVGETQVISVDDPFERRDQRRQKTRCRRTMGVRGRNQLER